MPPTSTTSNRDRWIAGCATNRLSDPYFVNGENYTTLGGTSVPNGVWINGGAQSGEKSDYAIAFLATWDYHMSEKNMIKSFEFIPICPKKNGFKIVINEASIAIFVLNNFFVNKYRPKILNEEKDTFTKCITKSILFA